MKNKSPKRSEDQERITFNLPKSLKEKIELAAKDDKRRISPWLVKQLEELLSLPLDPANYTYEDPDISLGNDNKCSPSTPALSALKPPHQEAKRLKSK